MPDREAVSKADVATLTTEQKDREQRAAAIATEGAKKSKQIHDCVTALEKLVKEIVPEGAYRDSGLQLLGKAHRVFVNQIFSQAVRKA